MAWLLWLWLALIVGGVISIAINMQITRQVREHEEKYHMRR